MLDIAIIGAGPAGLSAALNGVIRNKKVEIFGKKPETSAIFKAENVNNYLGMPNLTGEEMIDQFLNHALDVGVKFNEALVSEIYDMGDYYTLNVDNDFVDAKTILVATGIPKARFVLGEEEYIGRGVSYCATCDGMLYRDRDIIVVAEDKEAYAEEVRYLQDIAKKVYLVAKFDVKEKFNDNVEVIKNRLKIVKGEDYFKKVELVNEIEIEAEGLFILRETMPVAKLIRGIEMDENFIKVNRNLETNLKGIYAAGDCTGKPFQVAKAVGEGLTAGLNIVSYIDKVEKIKVEEKELVSVK